MTPNARAWLVAAAIVIGLTMLTRFVQRFLVHRLGSWTARTRFRTDDLAVDLVRWISVPFLLATYASVSRLSLTLPADARSQIHWLFISACVYQAGVWGNGVIAHLISRRRADPALDGGMATTLAALGFGVTYQTPRSAVATIPGMVRSAIEQQSDVRFDRAHFKEFGDSALNFEVVYYVLSPDYNRYMDIQQAINLEIMEQFEGEEIQFAHPMRTLRLPDLEESFLRANARQ